MAPRRRCAKGAVHITARVINEGRKVRFGYLPFRTNASTLPITSKRSSLRDVEQIPEQLFPRLVDGVLRRQVPPPQARGSGTSVASTRRRRCAVGSRSPSSAGDFTAFIFFPLPAPLPPQYHVSDKIPGDARDNSVTLFHD
ncbi:hypothetical protein TNCV_1309111 [Trichonephila clavipes]|nr:hypothetical protein TNCV_1309111 [Trichonephila clavipes]